MRHRPRRGIRGTLPCATADEGGYVSTLRHANRFGNIATVHDINGDPALVAIERAIHELRCGRVLFCSEADPPDTSRRGLLVASAETASPSLIARIEKVAGEKGLALALTRERADTLGLRLSGKPIDGAHEAVLFRFHQRVSASLLNWLAGVDTSTPGAAAPARDFTVEACDALTSSVLQLAKRARLLPAVLVAPLPPSMSKDVLAISTVQLERLVEPTAFELERVSEARVPLAGHEQCRLVLFRDGRDASEHVAVLIGTPKRSAVSVRLHSACLTGDLLGSLRCDCGDQLRTAVDQLAAVGGGVLLYLAQEGRGIGLANKLRAYQLQDAGLDTIEADRHLGFSADERSYGAAASMLRQLGLTRIQLLTNNLEKIEALRQAGIEVVGGQRLIGAVNRHNARYVHAKRERAGHLMPEINMDEML